MTTLFASSPASAAARGQAAAPRVTPAPPPPPALVSLHRLGPVLRAQRAWLGVSLEELAVRSRRLCTPDLLAAVESGDGAVDDGLLILLGSIYQLAAGPLGAGAPGPLRLVLDRRDARDAPDGDGSPPLGAVLARYAALAHALRARIGPRDAPAGDADVLAYALGAAPVEIARRLHHLAAAHRAGAPAAVAEEAALTGRAALWAAGVLAAAGPFGTLVLEPA
ncbi:MAG: hypothetical protein ACKVWR_15015 [Acidimicrobiales bacterium]